MIKDCPMLFQPLEYCEMYPVHNYSVDITESGYRVQNVTFISNQVRAENLLENSIYEFQIIVWNSVGSVNRNEKIRM